MQQDQPTVTGPAVHVVGANVSLNQTLVADGRIELVFDTYLLPACITRQAFQLHDLTGLSAPLNVPAYDPVARVVTITPASPLQAGQNYVVNITTPSTSTPIDPTTGLHAGLRAIDGATIFPGDATIEFPVVAAGAPQAAPPTVDFCKDILPLLRTSCAGPSCHGATPPGPAAGLRLDSPTSIQQTALGRVGRAAQGANTGASAYGWSAGLPFGINMPLIDPGTDTSGGDPGNSWLLYKLLLAIPTPPSTAPSAAGCDGGPATPTDVSAMHVVAWQPPEADRAKTWLDRHASLSDYVQGREMPFPLDPGAPIDQATAPLTVDQLERISRWIAQPTTDAPLVPATCDCSQ